MDDARVMSSYLHVHKCEHAMSKAEEGSKPREDVANNIADHFQVHAITVCIIEHPELIVRQSFQTRSMLT